VWRGRLGSVSNRSFSQVCDNIIRVSEHPGVGAHCCWLLVNANILEDILSNVYKTWTSELILGGWLQCCWCNDCDCHTDVRTVDCNIRWSYNFCWPKYCLNCNFRM